MLKRERVDGNNSEENNDCSGSSKRKKVDEIIPKDNAGEVMENLFNPTPN